MRLMILGARDSDMRSLILLLVVVGIAGVVDAVIYDGGTDARPATRSRVWAMMSDYGLRDKFVETPKRTRRPFLRQSIV